MSMQQDCENKRINMSDIFGSNVFNDSVMKERLPKNTYKALKSTIDSGAPLDPTVAEIVANAIKDWAIEKGATHFTHWFQPLTGITAEKHESFISPTSDGKAIMEFSGKELKKGEPDASSFPSGGIRATFEARGYTVWDCTSPAFLKEDDGGVTLCIPTAFCAYTGEALDLKTPLLRSMETLSKEAVRILRLFGNTTSNRVIPTVGAEQEYFLIQQEDFKKRKDLLFTGRTLFGAKPPKGQELDDHYFGILKGKVASFMKDLDVELWKLGVSAKTKHNEVAPAQHELASIYDNANKAADNNQLTMEVMKRVAGKHGLTCLLHEKPFAGVNGSGKHNNWSLSTDDGQNLLDPGKTPHENAQFLLFLCAVIKSIDDYADLLRVSAANPGNDHRLGANEAPPAIVSIFLGDQLKDVLDQLENGEAKSCMQRTEMKIGVTTLPRFRKDTTDRNRTSPFAFTGNKFEFRMVPSSGSISDANVVLNTIVAETLSQIGDRLEKAEDFDCELHCIIKEIVKKHKKIIFDGDGYSEEWVKEAERRGLRNIRSTVDAIPALIEEKNIRLFEKHGVMNSVELHSRYEIMLEAYIKQINIEALTMIEMSKRDIMPSAISYIKQVAEEINQVKAACGDIDVSSEQEIIKKTSEALRGLKTHTATLEELENKASSITGSNMDKAVFYKDKVAQEMKQVRMYGDMLEEMVDSRLWPMPTYGQMLFYV